MEYPILFKNVSENYANEYKDKERESRIIGFVNPDNKNDFGYIISGGRQYGLSYQTLKGYIDTAYNNSKDYTNTTVNTAETELTALITNEIQELSNTVNSYYSSVTDKMMNYSTSTMQNCSNTSNIATLIAAIKINQTHLQTYLVGSVSIKVNSLTVVPEDPAQMIINRVNRDKTETTVACSLNFIKQSDYKNKYVTWYFDTFLLENGLDYIFKLVDKNNNNKPVYISPHITQVSLYNNHIACIGADGKTYNNFSPAFGVNLSNIYTNDIAVNKTSIEKLTQSIKNLNMYIEDIYTQSGWTKPNNVSTL